MLEGPNAWWRVWYIGRLPWANVKSFRRRPLLWSHQVVVFRRKCSGKDASIFIFVFAEKHVTRGISSSTAVSKPSHSINTSHLDEYHSCHFDYTMCREAKRSLRVVMEPSLHHFSSRINTMLEMLKLVRRSHKWVYKSPIITCRVEKLNPIIHSPNQTQSILSTDMSNN